MHVGTSFWAVERIGQTMGALHLHTLFNVLEGLGHVQSPSTLGSVLPPGVLGVATSGTLRVVSGPGDEAQTQVHQPLIRSGKVMVRKGTPKIPS